MSQTDFAALADTSKRAQIRYESGERSPDAEYLARLARHRVDIYWVITGKRR
jgi:transcriptional regulator with XRE-family HTH domain